MLIGDISSGASLTYLNLAFAPRDMQVSKLLCRICLLEGPGEEQLEVQTGLPMTCHSRAKPCRAMLSLW